MKQEWIERARKINEFHASKLLTNSKWTVKDTSKSLGYSLGSISQYLTIASWLRTHGAQLDAYNDINDAMTYIKKKKLELKTRL